jgi:nucleotide-binding universal stress UspA family protein
VLAGHPVRTIVELAGRLPADLLVIGARGLSALYERMIGSRADRMSSSRRVQCWSRNEPAGFSW